MARKIYLRQGTGVGALKKRFGGSYRYYSYPSCLCVFISYLPHKFFASYRRGARPKVHNDASGNIIRKAMLELDKLAITEACGKGGRKITSIGQRALDQVARQVAMGEA